MEYTIVRTIGLECRQHEIPLFSHSILANKTMHLTTDRTAGTFLWGRVYYPALHARSHKPDKENMELVLLKRVLLHTSAQALCMALAIAVCAPATSHGQSLSADGTLDIRSANAKCDGATDDSAAIDLANQTAIDRKVPLRFPAGARCEVSRSFTILSDLAPWISAGKTTLEWSTDLGSDSYALRIYQQQSGYPYRASTGAALSGIAIQGSDNVLHPYVMNGVILGDLHHKMHTQSIENLDIFGFATAMTMLDGVWRIRIQGGRWQDNGIQLATPKTWPGSADFGESMVLEGIMFADSAGPLHIGAGEWHLRDDSFDNVMLWVDGAANLVSVDSSHFENPGSYDFGAAVPHFVTVSAQAGLVRIVNSELVLDCPESNITSTLFHVEKNVTEYGLELDGDQISVAGPCYRPDLNAVHPTGFLLEDGGGRFTGHWSYAPTNFFFYGGGSWNNRIINGDFELGSTRGWSISPTDTANAAKGATFQASQTAAHTGLWGATLTAQAGDAATVEQSLPVHAGDAIGGSLWLRGASWAAGCAASLQTRVTEREGSIQPGSAAVLPITVNPDGTWSAMRVGSPLRVDRDGSTFTIGLAVKSSRGACSLSLDDVVVSTF